MKQGFLTAALGICALLFAAPAVSRGDIIFTNYDPSFSYNIGAVNFVGNGLDATTNNYAQGDTFTPAGSYVFGSLDISLVCFFGPGSCSSPVTVSLETDSAGVPGATLETFNVAGPSLAGFGANNPPVVLNAAGPPLLLTAGKPYWVTVSSSFANSIGWNLNSTGDMSNEAISTDGGTTWFAPSGLTPGAYQVNGTAVPEPKASVLLAIILSLLVLGKSGARLRNRSASGAIRFFGEN